MGQGVVGGRTHMGRRTERPQVVYLRVGLSSGARAGFLITHAWSGTPVPLFPQGKPPPPLHMGTPSPDSPFGLVQASPHGSWVLAPSSFREKPHVPPALTDGSDQSLCSLWGTGKLDEPLPCRYCKDGRHGALAPTRF